MGFDRAIEHHFHGAATSRRRAAASLHQREVLRKLLSEALAPLVEVFTGRCCLQKAPTEKSALFVCPIIPRQNWRRS